MLLPVWQKYFSKNIFFVFEQERAHKRADKKRKLEEKKATWKKIQKVARHKWHTESASQRIILQLLLHIKHTQTVIIY